MDPLLVPATNLYRVDVGYTNTMRLFAALSAGPFALCLLGAPALIACAEAPTPARPNVLLLSVDSLRRDHVSALGHVNPAGPDTPTTPAFERLAREGVLFENAVSTTSWTTPSTTTI